MKASFGERNLTAENHRRKTALISRLEKAAIYRHNHSLAKPSGEVLWAYFFFLYGPLFDQTKSLQKAR